MSTTTGDSGKTLKYIILLSVRYDDKVSHLRRLFSPRLLPQPITTQTREQWLAIGTIFFYFSFSSEKTRAKRADECTLFLSALVFKTV